MHKLVRLISGLPMLAALSLPCAAQAGKVEALGPLTETTVPAQLRQVLDAKGYRVLVGGNAAAELWFRKDLAAGAVAQTADVIYDRLAESNLVGVIRFPQASTDYRGQAVPAGFYGLRYELAVQRLSVARRVPLPVSYLTTGQDVPDDIEHASARRVARLVVGEESLFARRKPA